MRRVHAGRVGQRQQLRAEAVVQLLGELLARASDRRQQIGPPDVADEQRVARQHPVRDVVAGVLPDHDAHRLGGVAWRVTELEHDVAERLAFAVGHLAMLELGFGDRRVGDRRAGGGGQLEMARQEVGVEVGLDHELDRQPAGLGVGDVLVDVALRVDDDRSPGRLVADQVRRVRETLQVVLVEQHARSPCPDKG